MIGTPLNPDSHSPPPRSSLIIETLADGGIILTDARRANTATELWVIAGILVVTAIGWLAWALLRNLDPHAENADGSCFPTLLLLLLPASFLCQHAREVETKPFRLRIENAQLFLEQPVSDEKPRTWSTSKIQDIAVHHRRDQSMADLCLVIGFLPPIRLLYNRPADECAWAANRLKEAIERQRTQQ